MMLNRPNARLVITVVLLKYYYEKNNACKLYYLKELLYFRNKFFADNR